MLTITDSILDRIRNFQGEKNENMKAAKELLIRLDERILFRFVDEALIKTEGNVNSNQIKNDSLLQIAQELAELGNKKAHLAGLKKWEGKDIGLNVWRTFNILFKYI